MKKTVIATIICILLLTGCAQPIQNDSKRIEANQNIVIKEESNTPITDSLENTLDNKTIEDLLALSIQTQQETNELLRINVNAMNDLTKDFNRFKKDFIEHINDIEKEKSSQEYASSKNMLKSTLSEFGDKIDAIADTTKQIIDRPIGGDNITNVINNIYSEAILTNEETHNVASETNNSESEKSDGKDGFTLTEDTIFQSGDTISIEASSGETYAFKLQLFEECLNLTFDESIDLSKISVELFEEDEITTRFLWQNDSIIYTDSELDGIFFLVLKDLPEGLCEISVGL